MASFSRRLAAVVGMSGLTLLLLPKSFAQLQSNGGRIGPPLQGTATASVPSPEVPPQPVNMLQQPARDAQVAFAGDRLSIHADNSSLTAILRQVATESGMKITGLASDERVFGTFGPGSASDVLADLLNGTAYDVMLIGNASYGAPRELILTPSRMGGQPPAAALAGPSQAVPDETVNDQESQDAPLSPPEAAPPGPATPPGIRTPQQLFQQLQQMRQAQQQQIPQQEQQPQTPPQ